MSFFRRLRDDKDRHFSMYTYKYTSSDDYEALKKLNLELQEYIEENNRLARHAYDIDYDLNEALRKNATKTVEILKPELNKAIKELKDSGVIEKIRILQGQRKGLEISIYGKPLRHDSPSTGLPPPHRCRYEELRESKRGQANELRAIAIYGCCVWSSANQFSLVGGQRPNVS